jgi:hypothetical protein
LTRFQVTQPREMTYVAIRATVERESMALKATVLPMLMRERTIVKMQVKIMELTGMRKRGWTWGGG